jgi:hypothetical protein
MDTQIFIAVGIVDSPPIMGAPYPIFPPGQLVPAYISAGAPIFSAAALQVVSYNLTPASLIDAAPTLGAPLPGGYSTLLGASVATVPILGVAGVQQRQAFGAAGLLDSAPVLGVPTFAQSQNLVAAPLTDSAPLLGTASMVLLVQSLASSNLTDSPPIFGSPIMGRILNSMVGASVSSGSPVFSPANALGTPFRQTLAASSVSSGHPVLGLPGQLGLIVVPAGTLTLTALPPTLTQRTLRHWLEISDGQGSAPQTDVLRGSVVDKELVDA